MRDSRASRNKGSIMDRPPDLERLYEGDNNLRGYEGDILQRWQRYRDWEKRIITSDRSLAQFALGYQNWGIVQHASGEITVREWVENGSEVSVVGDFNNWDCTRHVCSRNEYSVFTLSIPPLEDGSPAIPHGSHVKLWIRTKFGQDLYRLSPWTKYATQDMSKSMDYQSVHWSPPTPYKWVHDRAAKPSSVRIYEAHVGISSPDAKCASYRYFADNVLPRVKALGYTCVELMAIMEHAYYGSFGYHVTNFFAVSSRYGNPNDFKYLIDTAHGLGLYVILDIVHSHAAKNVNDGLNRFDGTDSGYFHDGGKGEHALWGSRIFDFSKWEVIRFLLSNLRWYVEEYKIDGFRFDGITAMLYLHRGIGTGFTGAYHEYFNMSVDVEALVYLMMANSMLHNIYPNVITIAEDVSGMPALGRPVNEGGVGFDYRMAMALPDMWIKLLKEVKDEDWSMGHIWWTLTNRRAAEKCVAYTECHDQALVGDKTLAFWLMDAQMYTNMSTMSPRTPLIDRGMALHKLIRLATLGLGGEAYLTFIGNEFGHPEWLDFPREGNNFSYHYARRQFNLVDDDSLRYKYLNAFDSAMQKLDQKFQFLNTGREFVSRKHDGDKLIAFERGGLVWILNFHPSGSYVDYRIAVERPGKYYIGLDSDHKQFDGHSRVDAESEYIATATPWDGREYSITVYIPCRTGLILFHEN